MKRQSIALVATAALMAALVAALFAWTGPKPSALPAGNAPKPQAPFASAAPKPLAPLAPSQLSGYMPPGAALYLETKDFSSLLERMERFAGEKAMAPERQLRSLFPLAPFLASSRSPAPIRCRGRRPTGHEPAFASGGQGKRPGPLRHRQSRIPLHRARAFRDSDAVRALAGAHKI